MIFEKINLEQNDPNVYLDAYIADEIADLTRKAILVIPGGAYWDVCADREGEPIAMAFLPYGYNAFVLHYSTAGFSEKTFPVQLIQASKAMKHIKDHAQEYHIDADQVFVVGFSAGGHLAGSLGTMWHKKEVYEAVDMPYGYNKPAGMMLIYPVVTGIEDFGHHDSFYNLLGSKEPTQEQLQMCSLEKNVDDRTVPAFLVHTSNDQLVDVQNSLVLAQAFAQAGLKYEMHVYPDGPHGVALGNQITRCGVAKWENPNIAKWVENAAIWAEEIRDEMGEI